MLAILHHGSVSSAAREVNLTQPAITQGLATLEGTLGERLFDRSADGMLPTPAALLFEPRARAALELIDSGRVTATQMRAFSALAEAGSYAGAAARVGVSQASIHRAVADLTIALGFVLVERRGRGLAVTTRGRAVARRFGLARSELEAGLDELDLLRGRETGRIAVGSMPLVRAKLLPTAIARFSAQCPDFTISIMEGSHSELLGPLRDGHVDVLMGALRDPPPGPDLKQAPLFEDRPAVIARSGHPLAGYSPDLGVLADYPWVVAAHGAPLRDQWERMFVDAGLPLPTAPVQCGSVITIRQLLIQSDFLTLLSPDQVALELETNWLAIIRAVEPAIRRTIGFTTRTTWRPTPLQHSFLQMVRQFADS